MRREITRKEALELSQKTLEDAERARIETAKREAKAAACPDCEDLRCERAELLAALKDVILLFGLGDLMVMTGPQREAIDSVHRAIKKAEGEE